MYLDFSQIFQLAVGLIGAIIILIAAYGAPLRVSIGILLFLIPFQPIETRFGSANILMTYVLFGALVLRGRLRYLPMPVPMLLVIFAYLVSISQLPKALYFDHGLHFFFIVSGLLVFVLAYNLAREEGNPRYIVNILIAANVLAVAYCLVQFVSGPGERMIFFGMNDLWMHRNRGADDPRLVGPFGTPGITAAYFMTMTVLLAYETLHAAKRRKIALAVLACANVAMIMATANRGSFLVLLASMLGFLYIFRAELGVLRAIHIFVASVLVVAATGILVANYSEFGNMFARLERVGELEGGIPTTRQGVWPAAIDTIPNRLWLGHGPYLAQSSGLARSGRDVQSGQLVMSYPHNLYLHLLLTLGIVGTAAVLYFFFLATWRIYRGAKQGSFATDYERGLVVLGTLLLVGFFVDEIKIEFLRHSTIDYVHFILGLVGIFLGLADRGRVNRAVAIRESQEVAPAFDQRKSSRVPTTPVPKAA